MFEKKMKKLAPFDISLIKIGVVLGTLFVVSVCPTFAEWVVSVHWGWFLGLAILAMLRPGYRLWVK